MSPSPDQPRHERHRFRDTALASGLIDESHLAAAEAALKQALDRSTATPADWDQAVADRLVHDRVLTAFQAREILAGRRRFRLGQYTVLDEVARGGMGQVFRAEHAMMGREVAVKVLPRAKATPESEAAFRREMRMLGRLDHENLVRAFDAGYDAMVYYLVTELVPGLDLKRQVHKHGPLDEPLAASVISQAARGLAYAHEQGLVHRDVKPGNLIVMPDGRVKVLDLGLAGSQIEEESSRLGRVVGTMDYIAPEQIRTPDDVAPAADVYALGCTLYFAVTGQVPFPGGTRREKMQRHLSASPVPVRELAPRLSGDFCRLIEAMMAKNPLERVASAAEVAERLRPWMPAVPPPMPREAEPRRDAKAPPALRSEQAHGPAWLTSWARLDAPVRRSEEEASWLLGRGGGEGTAADRFTPPMLGWLRAAAWHRVWKTIPQAVSLSAVIGLAVGAAAGAMGWLAPVRFRGLELIGGPMTMSCLVFALALAIRLATAAADRPR